MDKTLTTAPSDALRECRRCGEAKPAGEFPPDRRSCRECERARYRECDRAKREANPEAYRERRRAYYLANPEPAKKRWRAYREAHPERVQAIYHAYQEANGERLREYQRDYRRREENRERLREYQCAYREANPERMEGYWRAREARKRGATKVEMVDRAAIIARDAGRCYLCGELPAPATIHLDHVVPLSRGGEHTARNLRVTCAGCNLSKGDRLLSELARPPALTKGVEQ